MNQDHYVNRMVGLCRKWRVECEGKHLKCSGDENGLQISVQTIQLQLQKGKRKQRPFIDVVNVGRTVQLILSLDTRAAKVFA